MGLHNKVSRLLVINAGSSSLKFKLFESSSVSLQPVAWGLCERLGTPQSKFKGHWVAEDGSMQEDEKQRELGDHLAALRVVTAFLDQRQLNISTNLVAVGHRVVHGLDISQPVRINQEVLDVIRSAASLAPLHNPPILEGIEAATALFPKAVQVAVFDTAFHQTLRPEVYTYPIDIDICRKEKIRKYGFHGISYQYLVKQAAKILEKSVSSVSAILCHLGAGASMCCVEQGRSVEVSMGMTPLAGLMMGTRCGDIDPAIPLHLIHHGMRAEDVDKILNKRSGFIGMTGFSDVRSVEEAAAKGDSQAQLALKMFAHSIRRYLGSFLVTLNGKVDALVFSAGIGEHSWSVREQVCHHLEWAGIRLDPEKNKQNMTQIQSVESRVKVLVIPTDEELEIAEQALAVATTGTTTGYRWR